MIETLKAKIIEQLQTYQDEDLLDLILKLLLTEGN